ncbi:MAG: HDOD domain-containing protein [Deltaproteobacteria bacterium]|nr:HDOD domain-containing protein [Deltaproteobacteria bacterium]
MKKPIYIGRQPIINGDKSIFGYEMLFRRSGENVAEVVDHLNATASVLENMYDVGFKTLISDKIAFINIVPDILKQDIMDLLPKDKIVLEILETSRIDETAVSIIQDFKNKGFRFALDDFVYGEEWEPILRLSDYVKIDVKQYSKNEIKEILLFLKYYGVKFLAEKVELDEDFYFYKSLGFNLYQGYFFQKPSVLSSVSLDQSYRLLINIFNAFQANADIEQIEALFKISPPLIFRLLKLINSVFYGFAAKISSLRQAIVLLGYGNVSRWILTMMLASGKSDLESDLVLESAIVKSRTMEMICNKFISKSFADGAFLAGMLSLISVALGMPFQDLLKEINIDSAISDALIDHKGKLGELIEFADAFYNGYYILANAILKKINPLATIDDILKIDSEALMYLEAIKKSTYGVV